MPELSGSLICNHGAETRSLSGGGQRDRHVGPSSREGVPGEGGGRGSWPWPAWPDTPHCCGQ